LILCKEFGFEIARRKPVKKFFNSPPALKVVGRNGVA
jgi:hypothetical protein